MNALPYSVAHLYFYASYPNIKKCEKSMRKEILDAPVAKVGPYSTAVKVGNLLFLSGQAPLDPETGKVMHGTIQQETQLTISNIERVLKSAGVSLKDVVKATVFLRDIHDFQAMNEVFAKYFGESPPARSTIEVSNLYEGIKVEIEVIAVTHD